MEELERRLEDVAAALTPEQKERVGLAMEEFRQGVADFHLAHTVSEDAKEALGLAMRFYEQT
jgi:hypothetical protein